jgi:tape measure domain-containing protein
MVVRELITLLGFKVDGAQANKYEKILRTVKRAGIVAGTAIAGLGTAFLVSAGNLEQTRMAFETMLGSAEAAGKALKDLTDFAARTPFERTDLIDYAKQLLAFGFSADELIPTLTHLGDIAAGVGKDRLPSIVLALGKIRTKGRATMEELNIMLEAGVPILDALAKKYGTTTAKIIEMVSKGQVGFAEVNDAIQQMSTGTGKFAGLMAKQSKSLLGMWSNVMDYFSSFASDIGTELLPMAKDLVREFMSFMEANKDIIKSGIVNFFKGLFRAIGYVVVFIQELVKRLGGWKAIMDTIVGILDIFWTGIKTVVNVLWPFRAAIIALAVAWGVVNAVMAMSPLTWIILGILAVIFAIGLLVKNWDKVAAFFKRLWQNIVNGVKKFVENVKNFFANLFKSIWKLLDNPVIQAALAIFAPFIGLPVLIIKNWTAIKDFFTGLWNGIVSGAAAVWDALKAGFQAVVDWLTGLWTGFKNFFDGIWQGIKGAVEAVGRFFGIGGGAPVTTPFTSPMTPDGLNVPQYAQGTPYVPENQLAFLHKGEQVLPRGSTSRSLNVNAVVNVAVPAGTPAAQADFVRKAARAAVQESWSQILRGVDAELVSIGG